MLFDCVFVLMALVYIAFRHHSKDQLPDLGSTTWTMVIQNSCLRAKHKSQQDVRLLYTGAGRFTGDKWWFQEIAFTRDKQGRITGFRLSAEDGLVRNLFFEKRLE